MSVLCESNRPELCSVFLNPQYDPNGVEIKAKVSQYLLNAITIRTLGFILPIYL